MIPMALRLPSDGSACARYAGDALVGSRQSSACAGDGPALILADVPRHHALVRPARARACSFCVRG